MFEVSADDVLKLGDAELRELVAKLCIAETQLQSLVNCVTWGGHQDAPDGGIDVRVEIAPEAAFEPGFIPCRNTGFQVKLGDFTARQIEQEMCPGGKPRDAISALAGRGGAYIIAAAGSNLTDSKLSERRDAMRAALGGTPDGECRVDFYDRQRLANWANSHAGVALWIFEKAGKPVGGWRPFGPWAGAGSDEKYIVDGTLRIHASGQQDESIASGLWRIRATLRQPRKIVRLVGLSGVGKTRFVQALFEDGELEPLPKSAAMYFDAGDDEGSVTGAIDWLIANDRQAILVVDNCTPHLHRRISERCLESRSRLSAITVEYDVRDDLPEETELITLEPSSDELIEKVVARRFPELSHVNLQTVAEFAGGNTRIALALARTIGHAEHIAGLNERELFERLIPEELREAAEVCSLLYSFDGQDLSSGEEGELGRLADLIGQNAPWLFRMVSKLVDRQIVQKRGVWRAVLPHGIANRLAADALRRIPASRFLGESIFQWPERMRRSFARRLGYLSACDEAVHLVGLWLSRDGMLGSYAELDGLGKSMFHAVAPCDPEGAFSALKRTFTERGIDPLRDLETVRLLAAIAWEARYFERCADLLARIASVEHRSDRNSQLVQSLETLFYFARSGTMTPLEQRLAFIQGLLASDDEGIRAVGGMAIGWILECRFQTPHLEYSFGSRSRSYGYYPQSESEFKNWFTRSLEFATKEACSGTSQAAFVRKSIAGHLDSLWMDVRVHDDVESACRKIRSVCFWPGGWDAVRETLRLPGCPGRERLAALETLLRPSDTIDEALHVAVSQSTLANCDNVRKIGEALAEDAASINRVAVDLVSGRGDRLFDLGYGLGAATQEGRRVWRALIDAFLGRPESERVVGAMRGFLRGLHSVHPSEAQELLDEAVESASLRPYFPWLQAALPIGPNDVRRMIGHLARDPADATAYSALAWGRVIESTTGGDLRRLLFVIASRPGGVDTALQILHMRFHADRGAQRNSDQEAISVGRELLLRIRWTESGHHVWCKRRKALNVCLQGDGGRKLALNLCSQLSQSLSLEFPHCDEDFLAALFKAAPAAALDALFVGGDADRKGRGVWLSIRQRKIEKVLGAVPDNVLADWCDGDPSSRYPLVARVIGVAQPNSAGELSWSSTALYLLQRAPEPQAFLRIFVERLAPRVYFTAEYGEILRRGARLLDVFQEDQDLRFAARDEKSRLLAKADKFEREYKARERESRESFE